MSMPPAIANTFLFEMMKSKSKDITLAAIYALGEGRCQVDWPPESPDNQYHLNK